MVQFNDIIENSTRNLSTTGYHRNIQAKNDPDDPSDNTSYGSSSSLESNSTDSSTAKSSCKVYMEVTLYKDTKKAKAKTEMAVARAKKRKRTGLVTKGRPS